MKIRINDNNIRLRLSQSEVERFHKTGSCTNQINFPNGTTLTYKLAEGTDTKVSYDRDTMTIVLCEQEVEAWAGTDQVGIRAEVPMQNGSVGILVEKDFQCLTNQSEDQTDLYPNPKDQH